jgi:hypothetical protein
MWPQASRAVAMRYVGIAEAVDCYRRGENVARALRQRRRSSRNGVSIIEIAYDLQAGTYVRAAAENAAFHGRYVEAAAALIGPHLEPRDAILDIGSGEFTTLVGIANACFQPSQMVYGCELSLSRIGVGRRYIADVLAPALRGRLRPFVAEFGRLPLRNKSVDVVISNHALEPNRGRERAILRELARVARRRMILIEPYYEGGSSEVRQRMDEHAYIRDLPGAVAGAGAVLEAIVPLPVSANPLNPSHAFVVALPAEPARDGRSDAIWACPETGCDLEERDGFFFAPGSLLAYPVIDGAPILRREAAVLYSALAAP